MFNDVDNLKIINRSSKDIPEELLDAIFNKTLDEANDICAEWNMKIIEFERDKNKKETIVIGDRCVSSSEVTDFNQLLCEGR